MDMRRAGEMLLRDPRIIAQIFLPCYTFSCFNYRKCIPQYSLRIIVQLQLLSPVKLCIPLDLPPPPTLLSVLSGLGNSSPSLARSVNFTFDKPFNLLINQMGSVQDCATHENHPNAVRCSQMSYRVKQALSSQHIRL